MAPWWRRVSHNKGELCMAWSSSRDSNVVTSVTIHPVRTGAFGLAFGIFGVILMMVAMHDPNPGTVLAGLTIGGAMLFVAALLIRVSVRQTIRVVRAYFR